MKGSIEQRPHRHDFVRLPIPEVLNAVDAFQAFIGGDLSVPAHAIRDQVRTAILVLRKRGLSFANDAADAGMCLALRIDPATGMDVDDPKARTKPYSDDRFERDVAQMFINYSRLMAKRGI